MKNPQNSSNLKHFTVIVENAVIILIMKQATKNSDISTVTKVSSELIIINISIKRLQEFSKKSFFHAVTVKGAKQH